jgi:hypothetical protein
MDTVCQPVCGWFSPITKSTGQSGNCIVFVRTGFLDYWQQDVAHAVVIIGAVAPSHCWLHDPAQSAGAIVTAWHGLLAAWGEFAFKGVLLSRTR